MRMTSNNENNMNFSNKLAGIKNKLKKKLKVERYTLEDEEGGDA